MNPAKTHDPARQATRAKANPRPDASGSMIQSRVDVPTPSEEYRRADQAAHRGDPLPAEKLSDRSPKQENL
jgi:hypothetical protein